MALAALLAGPSLAQEPLVKTGESIAFLGDSITQQGWDSPVGYVRLVMSGLEANGIKAKPIPAGIGGHKSNDMLARLKRDVLDKNPTWMTLSCGVNDVWHGARGVPLPQYKTNITAIIERAQAAGIKVVIMTATMIGEDQSNGNNQKLIAYNDFLRDLAKEKKCPVADANADMQASLAAIDESIRKQGNQLTVDGVHMNAFGNVMMATSVLRAFGLNSSQLQKAKEGWMSIPNAVRLPGQSITLRQYEQLKAVAIQRKCSVDELLKKAFGETLANLMKAANQ